MVILESTLQKLQAGVKVLPRKSRQAGEDFVGPCKLDLVKEDVHDCQFVQLFVRRILRDAEGGKPPTKVDQFESYFWRDAYWR